MLERLTLSNIQLHKKLELEFSPGVNVIYGSTDSGKTSILRGLFWALLNRGTGQLLVNNEAQPRVCKVVVVVDGHEITRSCGATHNTYALDGHEFKAFRTSVPSEIAGLVNMGVVSVQERRDLPFMVYYKASENAEQFSSMLNITEIQTVITNCNKKVKAVQDAAISEQERLISVTAEIDALSGLDAAEEDFRGIQEKVATVEKQTAFLNSTLHSLAEQAEKATATVKEFSASVTALKELEAIGSKVRSLQGFKSQANGLNVMVDTVERALKVVRTSKHAVAATEALKRIEALVVQESSTKIRYKQVVGLKTSAMESALVLKDKSLLVKAKSDFNQVNVLLGTTLPGLKKDLHCLRGLEASFTVCTKAEQEASASANNAKQALDAVKGAVCPTCGGIIGDCIDGN